MLTMALIAVSPMLVFLGGVGVIIAGPVVKRGIKYKYDCATKGQNNPNHDAYSLIIGSMIHNPDEWQFDQDGATWPKKPAKYQIMFEFEKGKVNMSRMSDGGKFREVEGYWGKMFRDTIVSQASRVQSESVYKQLFPNGAPQLLLGKR